MFNPYYQNHPNYLPQQQVIQVNGKASVDTIQLAPNSSVLVMDTSAPIVWLCVSDGVGKVSATPYDIAVHKEKPSVDISDIKQRIVAIETAINTMEEKINAESNVGRIKSKQSNAGNSTDKRIE